MSSMRIMPMADFHAELRKYGFVETDNKTAAHTLWCHAETGKNFTIPNGPGDIPDSILEHYLRAVGRLYSEPAAPIPPNQGKAYCVTEKGPESPASPVELVKG